MTSGQKTAVSLLATVFLFAAFTIAAFSGLFSVIETRFYQPGKIAGIRKQLDSISGSYDTYINSLLEKFAVYTADKAVASYPEQRPSDTFVRERTKITGTLFTAVPGLSGIRIVDQNSRSVHFSTYSDDLLQNAENLRSYKNYEDLRINSSEEIPFAQISMADTNRGESHYKILPDSANRRILISYPFYDTYTAYRGTIIFYVNSFDFNRELSMENLVTLSENGELMTLHEGYSSDYGYIFGLPVVGRDFLKKQITEGLQEKSAGPLRIAAYSEGSEGNPADKDVGYWVLFSSQKSKFALMSGIYQDSIFVMPQTVHIVLLVCVFISLFLTMFLIFSLKHDDMLVIQNRIRRFQFSLVNEYLSRKMDVDWSAVSKNIENRRGEVSESIKRSLGSRRIKKYGKEVDELLDKSWKEIFTALNVQSGSVISSNAAAGALQNSAEIKQMLQEILSSGSIKVQTVAPPAAKKTNLAEAVEEAAVPADEVEPAEEIAPADEIEAVEEIAPADEAETVEEVEPADEAEAVEEVAAPADEVEPAEEADAEEIAPADEAETVEEVAPADEAEAVEEAAAPADEVEPAEEAEAVKEAAPADEAETVEEAAPADEAEAAEEAETVEEIAPADEVEPAEEIEAVEEVAPEEVAETVEEVAAADEVEPAEEAEAVKEAAPADEAEAVEEITPADEAETVEEVAPADEVEPAEEIEAVEEVAPEEVAETVEEVAAAEEAETVEEIAPVDEVEPADEAETVEEIAPAEDAETVEEVAPAEDAEAVEEVAPEEVAETVEEVAAAEEAETVEEIAPIDEVEPADEAEAVEEVAPADEAEAVEEAAAPADEVEPAEEIEAVEEVAPAEVAETVEEAAPADEAEAAEEAETVEEIAPAEEAEAVEEVTPVEEAAPADEAETVEEVAAAEEAEAVKEAAPADEAETVEEAAPADEAEAADEAETVEEIAPVDEAEAAEEAEPVKSEHSNIFDEKLGFDTDRKIQEEPDAFDIGDFVISSPDFSALDHLPVLEPADDTAEMPDADSSKDTLSVEETAEDSVAEKPVSRLAEVPVNDLSVEEPVPVPAENAAAGPVEEPAAEIPEDSAVPENAEVLEDAEPVEEIDQTASTKLYSFINFAADNEEIFEIPSADNDAIVADGDGLFHVQENLDTKSVKIDSSFKKLVESVIK